MNYLITGSKGFIGTNLVNFLLSKGETVVGLDYHNSDLCDGFPRIIKADVIVHLAAETDVRESVLKPAKTFLRNCQSTLNMLDFAALKKSKFIFASSQAANYCLSPYGASKLACEALIESYRNSYDLNAVILRLSNVYGPHSLDKTSVITKFIRAKLDSKPVQIYGDGEQTRDFIHVSDVCESIYTADRDMTISTGRLTSINKLAKLLDVEYIHLPALKGEVPSVDSHSEVPYSLELEEGLSDTFEWFKRQYKKAA